MRDIVLHGHIFKNAGTTLDWSLARSFGGAFVDYREDQPMRREGGRHLLKVLVENAGLAALSSHHLPRDIPSIRAARLHFMYLLRHPLLRIRSVYDFERVQQADTLGAQAAKRMSFREYVEWRMRPDTPATIRNFQTLYLAQPKRTRAKVGRDLRRFVDALTFAQSLPAIGVVEFYDESMVIFEEQLRPQIPELDLAYIPQNISGSQVSSMDQERRTELILEELGALSKVVIDNNSYDLALYQAACEKVQRAASRIQDFDGKLAAFRERCKSLREIHG